MNGETGVHPYHGVLPGFEKDHGISTSNHVMELTARSQVEKAISNGQVLQTLLTQYPPNDRITELGNKVVARAYDSGEGHA